MTVIILRLKALVDYLVKAQRVRLGKKFTAAREQQQYLMDTQADSFDCINKECDDSIERATQHAYDLREALVKETVHQVQVLEDKVRTLKELNRKLVM